MLFESTHEHRRGAEAPAEPGERIANAPLQRTLTAHIMGRWAKHEGAFAHISLILLFSQSFFLPLSLNPHRLTCLR